MFKCTVQYICIRPDETALSHSEDRHNGQGGTNAPTQTHTYTSNLFTLYLMRSTMNVTTIVAYSVVGSV